MSEIVTTTGRRMTVRLQEAIDNLTGSSRSAAIRGFAEMDPHSRLGPLYAALSFELQLCAFREDDTLRGMSADLRARDEGDDPPWPQATGPMAYLDDGNIIDPPANLP